MTEQMDRSALPYTPFFCEENVWHLCDRPGLGDARHVLWISSVARSCPFSCQRAAGDHAGPVWWDYHVVLAARAPEWVVWDLDTTLPFPVGLGEYLDGTFGPDGAIPAASAPWFRVIEAQVFRAGFSSDRSHMRRADGSWQAPPPPWPAIDRGVPEVFARLLDPEDAALGAVVDRAGLAARLA